MSRSPVKADDVPPGSDRLGARLREARQRRGLDLGTLSSLASCSPRLLSKIERGKAYPSLPMLHRIVETLDMNVSVILDDRDDADSSRLLRRVVAWAGSEAQALAWYGAEAIPALGGRTARQLVDDGHAEGVGRYLDHVESGGFA